MNNIFTASRGSVHTMCQKSLILLVIFSFIIIPITPVFAQEQAVSDAPVESTVDSGTVDGDNSTEIQVENIIPVGDQSLETGDTSVNTVEEKEVLDVENESIDLGKEELLMQSMSMSSPQAQSFDPRDLPNVDAPQTDENTGGLVYSYPIDVPPGRNNLDPKLALRYSSHNSDVSSPFGYGWSINIPYIERINKTGIEDLYTTDYFNSSLSGELINISGGNYAPQVEDGEFLKYSLSSNVWTVTDKSGTVYTFGLTSNSRQDDPSNSSNVYKWMLQEIRDTNNNYIKYEYHKDSGQIYPDVITYTGNNTTDGIFTIIFTRSSRNDVLDQSKAGFSVVTNYKITQIESRINGAWDQRYSLSYTTGDNSQKSLLGSVTKSGQDDNSVVTTLPSTTFTYQIANLANSFTLDYNWSTAPGNIVDTRSQYGSIIADVNGDGLPDILNSYDNGITWYKDAYINGGDGTWSTNANYTPPVIFASSGGPYDYGVRAADVNGDNLTDLVQSIDGVGVSIHDVYINTGSGWFLDTNWVPPYEFSNPTFGDTGGRILDLNGDGLPDFMKAIDSGGGIVTSVQINTGSGWISDSGWSAPVDLRYGVVFFDYNGDNLIDFIKGYKDSTGTDIKVAYKNNGDKTWSADSSYTPPIIFTEYALGSVYPRDLGVRILDINGDGLQDIVQSSDVGNSSIHNTYLNKSPGWVLSSNLIAPGFFLNTSGDDTGFRYADFNGDNMVDFYQSNGVYGANFKKHIRPRADLLSTVTNGYGGVTTVTYKGSPLYLNGSTRLNPELPYILDTVYQISSNYGFGNPVETETYEYEGGLYYFDTYLDRKPAGFSKITKTDSAGTKVINYYHQGDSSNSALGEHNDHSSKIGKSYRTEVYDSVGNLYQKNIYKWDKHNQGTNRDFVKLIRTTKIINDGNISHRDTAIEYDYNNTYGNVTTVTDWGEVSASNDGSFTDTGSDKSLETISYTSNLTSYIVGLPYQHITFDQSSTKVNETKTYYDVQSLGNVTDGNVTKVEKWISGVNYVDTQKTYNTTYGIPTSITDERGKVTSLSYDIYNLYPSSVTNPLLHTTQYQYDYSIGKPKHVVDVNNHVYQTIYDGLDRVVAEHIPDASFPYGPVLKTSYSYTDTANATSIQKTNFLDSLNTVNTYQYFDGANRLIQDRKQTETGYSVRDLLYNSLGLVQKESLPYSSTGSAKTTPTTNNSLYTSYSYDPMGRILSKANSIGIVNYSYDDFQSTVTDLLGNTKVYYKDARGNLVQVHEIDGFSIYITSYEWDLNKNLKQITDALNNVRRFTYDGLGRRITAEDLHDPADVTFGMWLYSYDDAGNMTQSISPQNYIVNYSYDDINRVVSEDYTGSLGTDIVYTYDNCSNGVGKLCDVLMLSGVQTGYSYDAQGNTASEEKTINSIVYTTSYNYDRQKNIIKIIYPDNAEVVYTYNSSGAIEDIQRKEAGGSFVGVVSNFDYAPHGQVSFQENDNGTETTKTYDSSNMYRLSRILTISPNGTAPVPSTATFYSLAGDGNIEKHDPSWDTSHDATTGTEYYTNNSSFIRTGIHLGRYYVVRGFLPFDTSAIPDTATITDADLKVYITDNRDSDNDGKDWVTVVQTSQSSVSSLSGSDFDEAGLVDNPIEGVDNGDRQDISNISNNAYLTFPVNSTGLSWVSATGNTKLGLREGHDALDDTPTTDDNNFDFNEIVYRTSEYSGTDYDPKLEVTYTTIQPVFLNIQDINYSYDANGNIVQTTDASDTDNLKTVDYSYDDLNRLLSASAINVAPGQTNYTQSFTYNALGNITNMSSVGAYVYAGSTGTSYANPHAATSVNGVAVTYDRDGNILTDGTRANSWNYKQQLLSVIKGPNTLNYEYDHSGNRVQVTNGLNISSYPNRYYNVDATGKITKNIYAGDNLVAVIEANLGAVDSYYVHTDHLNSTQVLTDSSGSLVETLDYYPFGEQRISSGSHTSQRQYIGQEYDVDTGLNYLNARYYGSDRGQFISQDPVFWTPDSNLTDPQIMNSYSYAKNNPLNMIDPDGEEPVKAYTGTIADFRSVLDNSKRQVGLYKGTDAQNYMSSLGNVSYSIKKFFKPEPTQASYFNTKEGRYIYTENGGWVDMSHFMFYAGKAYSNQQKGVENPIGEAVQSGYKQEFWDITFASHSAYSYEDLPSDYYGADFAINHFNPESQNNLGVQIENYFKNVLGAKDPSSATNYNSLPQYDSKNLPSHSNGTVKPVLFNKK